MTQKACELLYAARCGGAAVIGVGISNIPLIDFLLKNNIKVTARDKKDWNSLPEAAKALSYRGVDFICGADYLENICEAVIFRSPGVQPWLPQIKRAVYSGSTLTSEMELFFELTPAEIIGVTGSDGKTTTTTLIYNMLSLECKKRGGKTHAYVGGNIGAPLLPLVCDMTEKDYAVVELSSFQLQTMTRSPNTGIITNIAPNHLDWHSDMQQYTDAKLNIYKNKGCTHAVLNADNYVTSSLIKDAPVKVTAFSSSAKSLGEVKADAAVFERGDMIIYADENGEVPVLPVSSIRVPGRHNVENFMTAIAAVYGKASCETIREVAECFTGVEHRIEFVRTYKGAHYYNSSIDSSPSRTAAALNALGHGLVVICGGRDKKVPFAPLAEALCDHARAVILTGEAAGQIYSALMSCPRYTPGRPVIICDNDFRGAVCAARDVARPGDIVVLSPACTSFDAFSNFEERGNVFKKLVKDFE